MSSSPRILVVFLCETRGWELTAESFFRNFLDEVGADLALCVGDSTNEDLSNPFYARAKYVWPLNEPDDWGELYKEESRGNDWEYLLTLDEHLMGGIQHARWQNIGSGAIIFYFRRALRMHLTDKIRSRYDWIVITRSDFIWTTVHPRFELLNPARIYVLDGEHYGGVTDRYAAIPRRHVEAYLALVDPLFSGQKKFVAHARRTMRRNGWVFLNPERFLKLRMRDLGIWRNVRTIPYLCFSVRLPTGTTRWSKGSYDQRLGAFVKYPSERERAIAVADAIGSQADWEKYFSFAAGFVFHRRLDRICHRSDSTNESFLTRVRVRFGL